MNAILAQLASVFAETLAYLHRLQEADFYQNVATPWGIQDQQIEMFSHLIDHEIDHRAELSLILGRLGRTGFDA